MADPTNSGLSGGMALPIDINALLGYEDEQARDEARRMADAIRGRKQSSGLLAMTGDPNLQALGESIGSGADKEYDTNMRYGPESRLLRKTLELYKQGGRLGGAVIAGDAKRDAAALASNDRALDRESRERIAAARTKAQQDLADRGIRVVTDHEGNVYALPARMLQGGGPLQATSVTTPNGQQMTGVQARPSDKQTSTVAQYDQALDMVQSVLDQKTGVDTGPASNVINNLAQALGVSDPNDSQFKAKVDDLLARYVMSISGKAVTDRERAYLAKILPSFKDQDDVFVKKAQALAQRLGQLKQIELQSIQGQGKNPSGLENLGVHPVPAPAPRPPAPQQGAPQQGAKPRKVIKVDADGNIIG